MKNVNFKFVMLCSLARIVVLVSRRRKNVRGNVPWKEDRDRVDIPAEVIENTQFQKKKNERLVGGT